MANFRKKFSLQLFSFLRIWPTVGENVIELQKNALFLAKSCFGENHIIFIDQTILQKSKFLLLMKKNYIEWSLL